MGARGLEAAVVELASGDACGAVPAGPGGPRVVGRWNWVCRTPVTGGTEGALRVDREGPGLGDPGEWARGDLAWGPGPGQGAVQTRVPYRVPGSSWRAGQDTSLFPLEAGRSP